MKRFTLGLMLVAMSVAGCQCSNCGNASIGIDGGKGGGGGQSDGGTGGGGGAGGGSAGGAGGGFDAGDGTVTTGVPPGGFILDGGNGEHGSGVIKDPNGNLVLNTGAVEFHFMWIANSQRDWVSKYDTRTGREVARYYSVFPKDCAGSTGPPCANGAVHGLQPGSGQHSPSRTAIDLYGDVWIANRAPGLQGSVTKVANDVASCVDRNGDGVIQTSRDVNGDGQISTVAADGEMVIPTNLADPNQYDECVLFTTPVGTVGTGVSVRALAISAGLEGTAGDVWAGVFHERKFYKLNPLNGQVVAQTAQLSFGPYGAIVDRNQRLWAIRPGLGHLALIDTTTAAVVDDNIVAPAGTPCGSYALGIDGKNRVWLPGWTTGSIACRYDHATATWTRFDFSAAVCSGGNALGRPRGIAVDENGVVYMSADYAGAQAAAQLIRFDAETGTVQRFGNDDCIDATNGQTSTSIGVGLDGDGHPWINNYSGNAMKIDKATGAVTRTPQQPGGLYTYSDFTGYQLRRFTAPRGTYRKDFQGCATETEWLTLVFDSTVPAGTTLKAWVKVGATQADLGSTGATRYGPFTVSPVDLKAAGVPKSAWARVEFELTSSNGTSTPVLKSFSLKYSCLGGIN